MKPSTIYLRTLTINGVTIKDEIDLGCLGKSSYIVYNPTDLSLILSCKLQAKSYPNMKSGVAFYSSSFVGDYLYTCGERLPRKILEQVFLYNLTAWEMLCQR